MNYPRIYIAIATFLPMVGGAEKQALLQACSLRERGFEATIITFRHDKAWAKHEVIEGVPVIRIAGTLLGNREKLPKFLRKLYYLFAMVIIGWTLWQQRDYYDILHVYMLNLLSLPASIACGLTGKPIVVGIRCADSGSKAATHNKASLLAGSLDANTPWLQVDEFSWKGGDLAELERMGKPVARFTHFLLHRLNAVIVILSSRMKSYLTMHGFTHLDTRLIPNGVDTNRFHPNNTDSAIYDRTKVVICVSKFRFQKGLDVLLQAWYLVRQQCPQARLIIVGDGPLQLQLEQMTQALDITNSVTFAGLQNDIPSFLHRVGPAVFPSYWEGMPNALLEAMACGLPCVATRVSGSEDIIQHKVNGLLVEPGDYHALAQALLSLLNEPELIEKYGRAARVTIEQYYSLEKVIDTYVELYQSACNRRLQRREKRITN